VTRRRLDLELVRRGLVATPDDARRVIEAGTVTVAGRPAAKPETLVEASEALAVKPATGPYPSRGGEKLAAALDRFAIDPSGRLCLDAGASTGGFTGVLLARGAARVVAVDVGYGQLAWELRTDDRVVVLERTNVRELRPEDLPFRADIVTADLSFISLAKVVPALVELADGEADLVLLVKPQFEARREQVEAGGVVTDPAVWHRSLQEVAAACLDAGAGPLETMVSPLPGPAGNVEFFLHARVGAKGSTIDLDRTIREGQALRPIKGQAS
jgi:23S rRNA (cytidine1920-2'-O)/16S rRNA (cytidine1409-2'-O)-methyltransferase